jgi:hypothetical protein
MTEAERKAGQNEAEGSRSAQKALGRTERKAKKSARPAKRKNGR